MPKSKKLLRIFTPEESPRKCPPVNHFMDYLLNAMWRRRKAVLIGSPTFLRTLLHADPGISAPGKIYPFSVRSIEGLDGAS
jgi:hypothetical protein